MHHGHARGAFWRRFPFRHPQGLAPDPDRDRGPHAALERGLVLRAADRRVAGRQGRRPAARAPPHARPRRLQSLDARAHARRRGTGRRERRRAAAAYGQARPRQRGAGLAVQARAGDRRARDRRADGPRRAPRRRPLRHRRRAAEAGRAAGARERQGAGALRAPQHRRARRRSRLRRPAARCRAPHPRSRARRAVHQLVAVRARDQGRAAPRVHDRRQSLRFRRCGDAVCRARQWRAACQARRLRRRTLPRLRAARPAGAVARGHARRRPADRLRAAPEAVAEPLGQRRGERSQGRRHGLAAAPRRRKHQGRHRRAAAARAARAHQEHRRRRAAPLRRARRERARQPAARGRDAVGGGEAGREAGAADDGGEQRGQCGGIEGIGIVGIERGSRRFCIAVDLARDRRRGLRQSGPARLAGRLDLAGGSAGAHRLLAGGRGHCLAARGSRGVPRRGRPRQRRRPRQTLVLGQGRHDQRERCRLARRPAADAVAAVPALGARRSARRRAERRRRRHLASRSRGAAPADRGQARGAGAARARRCDDA